jgi:hypothetical protein
VRDFPVVQSVKPRVGSAENLVRRWSTWIEIIERELWKAFHRQRIWSEMSDAIVARAPQADATFLVTFSAMYAESQLSLIRRIAADSTGASLGRLVCGLHDRPDVITRDWFRKSVKARGYDPDDWFLDDFDRYADVDNPDRVSHGMLHDHFHYVYEELSAIRTKVNKTIAHADEKHARQNEKALPAVTYGTIRTALDRLGEITNCYSGLLRGSTTGRWTPQIQGDWQQPFRPFLFRERRVRAEGDLYRGWIAKWTQHFHDRLKDAEPDIPDELGDRMQDCWEPLLAIADVAGGPWPELARDAAIALSGDREQEDFTLTVQLLADIRTIFHEHPVERMPSRVLADRLAEIVDSEWADWYGRPIPPAQVARLLRGHAKPKVVRVGDGTFRGYERADFEESWSRYLPPTDTESV